VAHPTAETGNQINKQIYKQIYKQISLSFGSKLWSLGQSSFCDNQTARILYHLET